MSHLPEEPPDTFKYITSGVLSVQLGNSNPFGRVPVNQTCEEIVNKDTHASTGTKGFNLKPNAVCKYYLVAEYRSTFLRQLRDMLHINSSFPKHNDLHRSKITRDETEVNNIIPSLQDTWLNPVNPELQDLAWLSTGKVAPSEIKDDLLRAKGVGEKVYKAFREQRLECDPPNVKFHDTMKKASLKTFTDLNKKIKAQAYNNQEAVREAEKRLFA